MKKGKILKVLAIAGTCLCAPLLLSGCSNGNKNKTDSQNFRVQDGWVQFTQDGETWINLIEAEYPISQYDFRVHDGNIQWTTNGINWINLLEDVKSYTITFDYGAAYDSDAKYQNVMFPIFNPEHRLQSLDVKEGEWIGSLPKCHGVFEDSFLGWFIQGTDKQITEHDYIAGDITLEARFDFASSDAPAGLYQNGKYVKTWEQMIEDADIVVEDGVLSNIRTIYYPLANGYGFGDLHIDGDVIEIGDECDIRGGLTGVAIPRTVKSIGASAFSGSDLRNVIIDNKNNKLEVINGSAFSNCKELRNITIPSSVKIIEKSAFLGCDNLKSVTLEENGDSRDRWVIYDNFYKKSIISQDAVTTFIDKQIASYLKKGYEVIHIQSWCGMDAIELSDKLILASVSDKNISEYNCIVTNLNLDKYCVLDSYAFADCENLVKVTIGSKVDEIGRNVFKNCYGLTDISFEERDGYKWQVYDNDTWRDAETSELFDLAKAGKQLKRVTK